MSEFVLDTSAVMALLWDEDGASDVENLLGKSGNSVLLPFVTMMEVEYRLMRQDPAMVDEYLATIGSWPVEIVESNEAWGHAAAVVKHRGGLSFADSWVASLALLRDAALVHKDPEFDLVPEVEHFRLPYKGKGR